MAACFLQDIKLHWTFVQSYFPKPEQHFKLDPTLHKDHCILTKYGVINVLLEDRTEESLPDPQVYLKYLASRICVLVFNQLGPYTASEIIKEVSNEF